MLLVACTEDNACRFANFFFQCLQFLQVLSKIVQVALKYQLRMPPYFTLVLRSLACLEGTCNPIPGFSFV